MFFQDVVDRVECPECGAAVGEPCRWEDQADSEILFSHQSRYEAHRDAMTDEEFACLGSQMLERFKALQHWREVLR